MPMRRIAALEVTVRMAFRAATASLALAMLALLAAPRPAMAQQPIIIKFSHVVSPDAPKGKAAVLFKELAEKYTNGKVKVEVYPNSSLYKDKEELEALQLGSVQILAPSISKFGPLGVKEFDVFDLPFLMSDDARARQMFASPMMGEFNKKLEAKGVKPLAYWDNGAHVYTANKPLIMPDDFKGMKMRIQGSKVLDAAARELGAIPQIMAFSELYQALQTGVVDGEDNVPSNIWTQRFYEVQKEVLGWTARGCAPGLGSSRKGIDRFLQRDSRQGQCRGAREDQGFRQGRGACAHAGGAAGLDRQADAGAHRDAKPLRQGFHRSGL
jgi:C4-dicarboxylate-binding protein DctP